MVVSQCDQKKSHSHIAIVVTPPSLKSFANQKKLVKSQSGHTEKPFAGH